MKNFNYYSIYYDTLYKERDYTSDVNFTISLINNYARDATTILELGCGTGAHAQLFAKKGYTLHGIDLSETMLEIAIKNREKTAPHLQQRLSFSIGNAQNYRIGREFDVVLSLFHVVSYQTTNAELKAILETAAHHLKTGGIFIFDFWYGPAVLSQRPSIRVKHIQTDKIDLLRIAEPKLFPSESCVDVNYHIIINDNLKKAEVIKETHRMRYLFLTEIDLLANTIGFKIEKTCEWLSGREPSVDTWGVCAVLSKTRGL